MVPILPGFGRCRRNWQIWRERSIPPVDVTEVRKWIFLVGIVVLGMESISFGKRTDEFSGQGCWERHLSAKMIMSIVCSPVWAKHDLERSSTIYGGLQCLRKDEQKKFQNSLAEPGVCTSFRAANRTNSSRDRGCQRNSRNPTGLGLRSISC